MGFLRRVLYLDALVTVLLGALLVAFPRVVTLVGQPDLPDYTWLRFTGAALFPLAVLMVLVGHRVEELWWWSWAFVIFEAGLAIVATLHAAIGLPPGAAAWPWWALGVGAWLFAGAFLWGIARAGVEAPAP